MPAAEQWRPIPGYPHYMISSKGRVLSWAPRWKGTDSTPRLLAPGYTAAGYPTVVLTRPDAPKGTRYIHHLVAEAFIGPRPDGMEACHNDGDPANCLAENLRWDSPSANRLDTVRHGRHHEASKTHCKRGHEFAGDNLIVTPRQRRCRTCTVARRAAAKQVAA